MSANLTALLIALAGGGVAALVTGYFARPKTVAEAEAVEINANVSLSADAREWANFWMKQATEANAKAAAADTKADVANERWQDSETRIDNLETTLTAYFLYTKTLQAEIVRLGGALPPPPDGLRQWLG